jgi:glycosyltransferase involved in cell wall biosynthesis
MRRLAEQHGVQPRVLHELGREVSPVNDLRVTLAMYRLIRRSRPHIVHTHMAKAGTAGRLAAKLARVPIIVHTFHGHTFHSYWGPVKSAVFLQIERTLGAMTDRVIAVNDVQRADIAKYGVAPLQKIQTIPLGLEIEPLLQAEQYRGRLRAELGIAADQPLIGIVARLVPIKAHEVFLTAAAKVRAAMPSATFLIVGDGERRAELEALARSLGIADATRFLGWREDMREVNADLDVAALCSNNEGSPVALIEAMAAARPVVSTRVGGVPDVVHDGVSGLLVPAGDADAFADALLQLLRDPARAAAFGQAGREAVYPRHSSGRLVQDIERLYLDLARAKGLAA